MKHPIRFSQNFLHSSKLVNGLLAKTNISSSDIVYDIGSGKGIIAAGLASICHTVIAVEIDPKLVASLRRKFQSRQNVVVCQGSFLDLPLPRTPYKVFANIPFNLSADIVRKLVDSKNPPASAYLIVQKEFAEKLLAKKTGDNSQFATLLAVQFEIGILDRLSANDFLPRPKVTPVLLEILPRTNPLVPPGDLQLFRDFVVYVYNAFNPTVAESLPRLFNGNEFAQVARAIGLPPGVKPTQLTPKQWLELFNAALIKRQKLEHLVDNYEEILAKKHINRIKLHRTR